MTRNPYHCQCGMTFRTAIAEARHRHNFPLLCRKPKDKVRTRLPEDTPNPDIPTATVVEELLDAPYADIKGNDT